ncbi:MAG: cytochrome c-type biogenesis protein CcmH [Gammaproteobacteria bacterium]|nr:cytochrome c-type biogenesis protein CcmH [Gammaproteobacteria bacterium]
MKRLLLFFLLMAMMLPAVARVEAYHFDDPAMEARYKQLIDELRCLVCQNQNLADSNAELAQDMRRLTYEMVSKGESNEAVIAFMVQRYGDFVLYRPPFRTSTALLWIGPFIILAVGVLVLVAFIRKRGKERMPAMGSQDQERVRRLLEDKET